MDIDGPSTEQAPVLSNLDNPLTTCLKDSWTVSLKVYKTASCAEIAANYFNHWINVTCEKWSRFKEIGTQKIKLAKVVAKEKTSSPKGNDRSPESNLPRLNVVFSAIKANHSKVTKNI